MTEKATPKGSGRLWAIPHYYLRCLRLVWEAGRLCALLAFAMSMLTALIPAAQIWIAKIVIDTVIAALGGTPGAQVDWVRLLTPIAALLGVWVVGSLCGAAANGLLEQVGFLARSHTQYLVLNKAAQLDVAFFETPAFFDDMEKARGESYRAHNLAVLSVSLAGSAVSLVAMLGLLFRVHWSAVLVLLVTTAPQVVVGGHYAGRRFSLVGAMARNQRMAEYLSRLLGSREAVKEIRVFGLQHELLRRLVAFWGAYSKEAATLRLAQERSGFLLGLLSMVGTASIWAYAAGRAVAGRITVGTVALAFQAAEQSRSSLARFSQDLGLFYEHTVFAGMLFRFLDLDPRSVEGALAPPPPSPAPVPLPLTSGLELQNVSFRYPGSDRYVLKNVSLTIAAGRKIAIVGENGAGKTTLVKLLSRLYDPTEGRLLLDGRDLREYDLAGFRQQLGVIFQDHVRYSLSARENIGFGQLDQMHDSGRVERAAEEGGALDLVRGLPQGMDTILGKEFDEGVDLSGGEWQRIALSRAFMRTAQILILDEPTAALDPLAEHEVFSRFAQLAKGRTAVFISHRFSTVRMADHIIVLGDGELLEQGSHEELLARDGIYARMFNTQADRYR